MTELTFLNYLKYEDGQMACVETENEMPLNIFIDNFSEHQDMKEGLCRIDIQGVGSGIDVFSTPEEYKASESMMAEISLIPMGTFALPDDENWEPSPYIYFSGIVEEVIMNYDAEDDDANCCLRIKTLDITLDLYIRTEKHIEAGHIVRGTAWLYGDIYPAMIK